MNKRKVVVTGGAGLVGQNLIQRMVQSGRYDIVAIDKNATNAAILREQQPSVKVVVADLVEDGWQFHLENADALVIGQAQIGGLIADEFVRNNVRASEKQVEAARRYNIPYLVNISSSVVNSLAVDNYTETKKAQEKLVTACGIPQIVLRPTLMFGWFDRKHLGWLARFMQKVPVFPVPGNGRYMRQPMYVGDFCNIIIASLEQRKTGMFNISGQDRIDYIDLMRAVKKAVHARAPIVRIPVPLFRFLLNAAGLVTSNPPFTVKQLKALMTPDEFEVIDWPREFGVRATPLEDALRETFQDPRYSEITLQF